MKRRRDSARTNNVHIFMRFVHVPSLARCSVFHRHDRTSRSRRCPLLFTERRAGCEPRRDKQTPARFYLLLFSPLLSRRSSRSVKDAVCVVVGIYGLAALRGGDSTMVPSLGERKTKKQQVERRLNGGGLRATDAAKGKNSSRENPEKTPPVTCERETSEYKVRSLQ